MAEHPLTDDVLKQIGCENPLELPCLSISGRVRVFGTQAMRAAYDLGRDEQLEQVIEWMKVNLIKHGFHEGYAYLYKDLKKAMRPTTTQEDN